MQYLQKEPPQMPKMRKKTSSTSGDDDDDQMDRSNKNDHDKENYKLMKSAWQMWHRNGTRCPKGTVPIRRSNVNDVLRAKSLFHFAKKQRKSNHNIASTSLHNSRRSNAPDVVSGNGHEVIFFLLFFFNF